MIELILQYIVNPLMSEPTISVREGRNGGRDIVVVLDDTLLYL